MSYEGVTSHILVELLTFRKSLQPPCSISWKNFIRVFSIIYLLEWCDHKIWEQRKM